VLYAENYRHQADVCHAYHVLIRGGMDPSRVVVMMEDDIAFNNANRRPGQIFNCPGCPDVYAGVPHDYTGKEVNAQNVLKVLLGDTAAMHGIGSGRVIDSGPNDRVFLFYSDHGAPGILGMPHGPPIYADELVATLAEKRLRGGFWELVAFVEACESGSIFQGMLNGDLGVFAVSAASATEPSWATYCPASVHPLV
jgi:legumain